MKLKGKYGVVTGAAKGIGASIAERLIADGISGIAIIDIDFAAAEVMAKKLDPSGQIAFPFMCNVADAASVLKIFTEIEKQFSRIDILINNAGITKDAMFHKMTDEQWDAVVDVNLKGVYNCCKAVIVGMRQRQYGKIVSLASISAFGNFGQTNYGATKAAVIGFTKSLAKESGKFNITVNTVAPGYINTDMLQEVPDQVIQKFIDMIPAKRLGEPSEVASVVSFLSCDDSSFVNGECIVISGGSYT